MPTDTDTAGVTYLEAIGAAMMSEMEADPDVFLIGEDVGQFGGAFKVTKGFLEKFGPRRVVDTLSRKPGSPAWRRARRSSDCARSWSTSSPTSSRARSIPSSTCWRGTITAQVTRCR